MKVNKGFMIINKMEHISRCITNLSKTAEVSTRWLKLSYIISQLVSYQ